MQVCLQHSRVAMEHRATSRLQSSYQAFNAQAAPVGIVGRATAAVHCGGSHGRQRAYTGLTYINGLLGSSRPAFSCSIFFQ